MWHNATVNQKVPLLLLSGRGGSCYIGSEPCSGGANGASQQFKAGRIILTTSSHSDFAERGGLVT